MRKLTLGALCFTALLAAPAGAAEQPGRYTMSPVNEGMLRLDTVTGAVSLCQAREEEWSCETVADSDIDLRREVARLREENDALRADLEQARSKAARDLPDNDAAGKKQDRLPDARPSAPADETIDQMMTVFEKMMRRFRDMIQSLEEKKDERRL